LARLQEGVVDARETPRIRRADSSHAFSEATKLIRGVEVFPHEYALGFR
jgi:hypothetical protein